MSRTEEYKERYRRLHTGEDSFRLPNSDKLMKQQDFKELFTGIQFMRKFPEHIKKIAEDKGRALTIMDYGCGKGYMPWKRHENYLNGLWGYLPDKIQCIFLYDPGWPPFSYKPSPAWQFDVVGNADVMEHVPEEGVETVLADIAHYCNPDGVLIFSISGNKAFKSFEDGENLHCTIKPMEWWQQKIEKVCKRNYILIHSDDSLTPKIRTVKGIYK